MAVAAWHATSHSRQARPQHAMGADWEATAAAERRRDRRPTDTAVAAGTGRPGRRRRRPRSNPPTNGSPPPGSRPIDAAADGGAARAPLWPRAVAAGRPGAHARPPPPPAATPTERCRPTCCSPPTWGADEQADEVVWRSVFWQWLVKAIFLCYSILSGMRIMWQNVRKMQCCTRAHMVFDRNDKWRMLSMIRLTIFETYFDLTHDFTGH